MLVLASLLHVNAQNTIPTTTCTGAMKINDSLNVNRDIMANGDITSRGEVTSTDTMRAQKDVIVDGNVKVAGKINSEGIINTNSSLYIKNRFAIGVQPFPPVPNPISDPVTTPQSPPTSSTIFSYGGEQGPLQTQGSCSTGEYNVWSSHLMGGIVQVYDNSGTGNTYNNGGSILSMVSWPSSSSIDVSGGTGNGGLLMNYFCGKDIYMCTGSNGGFVSTGKNVEIGVPTRNSQISLNMKIQSGINKAINITNPLINNTRSVFEVEANGNTHIGIERPQSPHTNAELSVSGKIVCKSLFVLKQATWADFVFHKKEIESLESVEKYIKANKHLPGIPSEKEVLENGYDMNEMDVKLLEKIETLYLHIIALEKEIKELKNK